MRNAEFYIDRANAAFEAGFRSMAARKNAMADLRNAYDLERRAIMDLCLDVVRANRANNEPEDPAADELYWNVPDFHNWKARHADAVLAVFPDAAPIVARINDYVELRAAFAEAEIMRVQPNPQRELVERVQKSIRDIMAAKRVQYIQGVELYELFGGANVCANAHYVVNQFGTEFMRVFYYYNGRVTALNMIIAIVQEGNKRLEAKEKAQ
jgi:hypothetical protein